MTRNRVVLPGRRRVPFDEHRRGTLLPTPPALDERAVEGVVAGSVTCARVIGHAGSARETPAPRSPWTAWKMA